MTTQPAETATLGGTPVVWKVVVLGTMTGSPGAGRTLSDADMAAAAAQSASFDFLRDPEEDIYTLDDGREV